MSKISTANYQHYILISPGGYKACDSMFCVADCMQVERLIPILYIYGLECCIFNTAQTRTCIEIT